MKAAACCEVTPRRLVALRNARRARRAANPRPRGGRLAVDQPAGASATAPPPLAVPKALGILAGEVAVHVSEEAEADFATGAKRRKLHDKIQSVVVVAVAARHAETRPPLVLQLCPLRIADHTHAVCSEKQHDDGRRRRSWGLCEQIFKRQRHDCDQAITRGFGDDIAAGHGGKRTGQAR